MARWVRLCDAAGAPEEGTVSEAEAEGVAICLARVDGRLLALDNWCPHRRGPLGQGWVEGGLVVCPWHSWTFDAATGKSEYPENESVRAFPTKQDEDTVYVELPD